MVDRKTIEIILNETKSKIEEKEDLSQYQSGEGFEKFVVEILSSISKPYGIESIEHTGKQEFPDIIIDEKFGIEVKFTKSNKWKVTGNSIFQGTKSKNVSEDIFLFFGKKNNNQILVKWDEYSNCLSTVKVTHSPRFYIDMDIPENDTIFSKVDVDYSDFTKFNDEEKIKKVKDYMVKTLSKGEKLWWVDDVDDEEAMNPIITEYNTLDQQYQDILRAEGFVVCPEIFTAEGSGKKDKFSQCALYFLVEHQVINSSLRDTFTAGGRKYITISNRDIRVSRVLKNLYDSADQVRECLQAIDLEVLKNYWPNDLLDFDSLQRSNIEDEWKKVINKYGDESLPEGFKVSDVYCAGLSK
ncbi:hypothetical protein B0H94_12018 [Salsuginibacillus halophilus]|uniref:Restriction endonuclease n=1 Tax=Salsuginibacillus halophilus TaxID=517424 RepID=A0A2P8H4X0_9BACI|nr:hypothetical protein [Salsuginibacillus halophilus]PSL41272.1 hypothetical protein B0H94_12018 [Salsuginibacillus halophilus]